MYALHQGNNAQIANASKDGVATHDLKNVECFVEGSLAILKVFIVDLCHFKLKYNYLTS